jgi:glucose-1-phosphate cytidylyltransferase
MRVVLFCGGRGMRLKDYSDTVPKPMVPIGPRPLLWWVMKYYAHFGHKDFILCLGYKSEAIKDYFLAYNECRSNDFVLSEGGRRVDLLQRDIEDWRITFVETGLNANVGQRLAAVAPYLRDEEVFLANYSDGLTDFHLPQMIDDFLQRDLTAMFLSVRPNVTFHFVTRREDGSVASIDDALAANSWINGGYFVLRRSIFDYIRPGEELVVEPFHRLIAERKLGTQAYDGFWRCVDTFKDLQALESLHEQGDPPWELWRREPAAALPRVPERRRRERDPASSWRVRASR